MLDVRLDSVIIGAKKIYVNLPRYQRMINMEDGLHSSAITMRADESKREHRGDVEKRTKRPHNDKPRKLERKYVPKRDLGQLKNRKPKRRENVGDLCFEIPEEDLEKFNKMYVSVVKRPDSTHIAQEWLNM